MIQANRNEMQGRVEVRRQCMRCNHYRDRHGDNISYCMKVRGLVAPLDVKDCWEEKEDQPSFAPLSDEYMRRKSKFVGIKSVIEAKTGAIKTRTKRK